MTLTPNTIDGILFLILFIFAFLAFLKGFVKEFFSTLNLIISTVSSYIISPSLSKLFFIDNIPQILVDLIARFIIFVSVIIILSIIFSKISAPLNKKIPPTINQSLGFGFGFFKGYVVISFCFAMMIAFYSYQQSIYSGLEDSSSEQSEKEAPGPQWLKNSKSYNILSYGADFLHPVIDGIFSQITGNTNNYMSKDQLGLEEKIIESQELYDDTSGYKKQDRKNMDRLIEIIDN